MCLLVRKKERRAERLKVSTLFVIFVGALYRLLQCYHPCGGPLDLRVYDGGMAVPGLYVRGTGRGREKTHEAVPGAGGRLRSAYVSGGNLLPESF